MGQLLRHHTGTLTVPAHVLTDIEWVLDMHSAADRATVIAALPTPENRHHFRAPAEDRGEVHDYLRASDVHTIQALRGWNRLRHGDITVDARQLSAVRNILDSETYQRLGCDDHLSDLAAEADLARQAHYGDPSAAEYARQMSAMEAAVRTRLQTGAACGRCELCHAVALRDVLDELLDEAGFDGGPWFDLLSDGEGSARDYWRDHVMAPLPRAA